MSDDVATSPPITNSHDIVFLLDESESMKSMGTEPQSALNNFVSEQKELSKTIGDTATFTLYTFTHTTQLVVDNVPLAEVEKFETYRPNGMTKLYDTIGEAIDNKLKTESPNGVICVILTDGCDNSSHEYNAVSIRKLMDKVTAENGWNFVFLAANQDAFTAGASLGVNPARTATFEATPEGMEQICRMASDAILNYRSLSSEGDHDAVITISQTTDEPQCLSSVPEDSFGMPSRMPSGYDMCASTPGDNDDDGDLRPPPPDDEMDETFCPMGRTMTRH